MVEVMKLKRQKKCIRAAGKRLLLDRKPLRLFFSSRELFISEIGQLSDRAQQGQTVQIEEKNIISTNCIQVFTLKQVTNARKLKDTHPLILLLKELSWSQNPLQAACYFKVGTNYLPLFNICLILAYFCFICFVYMFICYFKEWINKST